MKHVIILGTGQGFEECPFDKDETWGIGKSIMMTTDHKHKLLPEGFNSKIDKIFNMDDLTNMLTFNDPRWQKNGWSFERYVDAINKTNVPLITSFKHEGFKNCVEFPLKKVVETFKTYYFTNSICYMIAYALLDDEVEGIHLWGINQVGMKEYINERKGVEFWIGLACGMGLDVSINGSFSALLKLESGRLYGYKRPFNELKEYFDIEYQGLID